MNYNERNGHPRDRRLAFDPADHRYTLSTDSGPVDCPSVTGIVESLFEPFNSEYWAKVKADASGRPTADILREWEENGRRASQLGTALHDNIERHYLGLDAAPDAASDLAYSHFLAFAAVRPLKPFRSEWRIFSERFRVAGTLDFLAFSTAEEATRFELWDWKRSSKIVKDGRIVSDAFRGRCGIAPAVAHIPDTSYWHYAIQLSLYRYILETEYALSVDAAHLGVFHPNYSTPYVVDVPYLRNEAVAILNSLL
ncbi:MAG: hypothetical protein K2M06_03975 [Muribaculaceae bacterium]|nr:hypothetical protein [Muribaculaceae bacterium]